MFNNRQEDLTKVFDRTWNANHNDTAIRGRERQKAFMNKMFGGNSRENNLNSSTPIKRAGKSAQNLQNNINNAFSGQRQANLNNIIRKFK